MVKTTVPIKGMHCKACEIVVSDRLLELPQVEEVSVDQRKGEAIITSTQSISTSKIASAVRKAGYQVGKESKQPWLSTDIRDYVIITAMVACVIAGYFSLQTIHWNGFGSSTDFASLPVVFFLGVIAGLSTCAALVGGLVVSAAAKYAVDHPMATALDKIKPHLLFNTGRIGGFALLGGVIGSLGSLVQLSLGTTAFVTVLVGLVMLILGLQLTRISPRLAGYSLAFPARFAQLLHLDTHKKREYGHFHTLLLGVLTFFLPCGFTQTVQLYAAGTGHPFQSALIMGVFALGTTPGLLTLGGVVAVVKGTFAELFFR
ncbi:hypothetical protein HGB07_07185, partial [Candidatus Roizmanbacteria bacterium]|nr:hypothetical protein [Candidatus Roizmanbacteria bacterium]